MNNSQNTLTHHYDANAMDTTEYRKMNEIVLTRASEIKIRPVEWMWEGWLAKGKFHILGGMAGTGKTNISLSMAATVSIGGVWPDGSMAEIGDVLIWSAEDDLSDTLTPRLRASGANLERIHFINGTLNGTGVRPFNPAKDVEKLKNELERIGTVSLIIFDPIVAVVCGDSNNNVEVRRGLQPIVDLAEYKRCAVLGIGCDPIEGMALLAMDTNNSPELRGRMYAELAQYVAPKRKAVEHSRGEDQSITFNLSLNPEAV